MARLEAHYRPSRQVRGSERGSGQTVISTTHHAWTVSTHHVVIEIVVKVPSLSSEQEPDQSKDGK